MFDDTECDFGNKIALALDREDRNFYLDGTKKKTAFFVRIMIQVRHIETGKTMFRDSKRNIQRYGAIRNEVSSSTLSLRVPEDILLILKQSSKIPAPGRGSGGPSASPARG